MHGGGFTVTKYIKQLNRLGRIMADVFFNFKKCKHMHLGRHGMNQPYRMKKGQELIPMEKVDSEKDLGVIIDKSLTFTEHINSKIKIANRNLGLIFRTFTYLDKDIFMNWYKSLVRPHLEYASSVWSPVYKKPWRRTGLQLKMYRDVPQSL